MRYAGVRIFWRPALLTLLLHGLLLYAVTVNWSTRTDAAVKPVVKPRFIEARLVELEQPKKKAKPKPKPKPAAAKPKQVASAPKPKPKPAAKPAPPKPEPEPEPKQEAPKPEPEPPQPEISALDELALAMEAEDEALDALSDDELTASYSALIARAVEDNWSRPPSARNNMEADLMIQLIPTGEVVSVKLARSSGNTAFDRSAINAVEKAARFPELQQLEPSLFEERFRRFRLKFKPEDLRY